MRRRPPREDGSGAAWWRVVAWAALGVTALALAALLLIAPGRVETVDAAPTPGSLSSSTRSALATLLGDDEVLRAERAQVRRALDVHREAMPPGSADSLITGLATLDAAIEELTRAWREEPTNVELMAQLARVWHQRSELIERAGALVRRAAGGEREG